MFISTLHLCKLLTICRPWLRLRRPFVAMQKQSHFPTRKPLFHLLAASVTQLITPVFPPLLQDLQDLHAFEYKSGLQLWSAGFAAQVAYLGCHCACLCWHHKALLNGLLDTWASSQLLGKTENSLSRVVLQNVPELNCLYFKNNLKTFEPLELISKKL